jgi:hypothetical protein
MQRSRRPNADCFNAHAFLRHGSSLRCRMLHRGAGKACLDTVFFPQRTLLVAFREPGTMLTLPPRSELHRRTVPQHGGGRAAGRARSGPPRGDPRRARSRAVQNASLRDVSRTADYMHDGSLATLREVVEYYIRGGTTDSALDPAIKPLGLSSEQVDHLVAFLKALDRERSLIRDR